MPLDPKIEEGIKEAVSEASQNPDLAKKIIKWFEAISTGNEQVADKQAANRHLDLLYDATQIPSEIIEIDSDHSFFKSEESEDLS